MYSLRGCKFQGEHRISSLYEKIPLDRVWQWVN